MKRYLAITAIIITTAFWGVSYTSTIIALGALSPVQVGLVRFGLVAILWHFLVGKRKSIEKKDWPRLFLAGMIGIPLYYCFENIGLSYTSASSGSLIIATIPGLNLLAGRIIWKERYPAFQLLGVFLSIIGVFLIIFSQASTAGEDSILGNILILGSALSWVAFIRLNQPLTEKYASLTLIYWQSLIGGLSFALFSLIEGKWANFHVSNLNGEVILHLAILTLLCSGAAYLFYFFAQSELGPTVTTTYLNLIPVFGVLTGILVLGEELAFAQLIGGLIVIIGIYLVTKEHQNKVIRDASKTI